MLTHLWDTVHARRSRAPPVLQLEEEEEEDWEEEEDTLGAETERRYDIAQAERELADSERARILSNQGGYRPQASVLSTLQGLLSNTGPVDSSLDSAASVELGMANATPILHVASLPICLIQGEKWIKPPVKPIQTPHLWMPCFGSL